MRAAAFILAAYSFATAGVGFLLWNVDPTFDLHMLSRSFFSVAIGCCLVLLGMRERRSL